MKEEERLYKIHADFCQALANPKRLKIINLLRNGEMSVNEMVARMGIHKANLSQHLSLMRQKGIVATRREGVNVYYHITNPKIVQACEIIREALQEQLRADARVIRRGLKKMRNQSVKKA
ncbi:MAG: metalloregulator ArsR/SmtB family transcription factor [Spirochaetota bacterium]